MTTPLYPLKFKPIYKDKIWGGDKLKTLLDKDYGQLTNCGESWEVSGVEGDYSLVSEGSLAGIDLVSLIKEYQGSLIGEKVYEKFGDTFPLLVKFIDANDDLSIQVHPADEIAEKRHNCFGKTEMWYVVQADEGSRLFSGFKSKVTKEEFREYSKSSKVLEVLNEDDVSPGDVYFLPAGRVHSIGKGLLIAEIQQTSDITYRVYDFDRVDFQGKKRDLHIEEALDVIDYSLYESYKTPYEEKPDTRITLISCGYFTTNKLNLSENFQWSKEDLDSFVIYMCLDGEGIINGSTLKKGETLLIPAAFNEIDIQVQGSLQLLESYVG